MQLPWLLPQPLLLTCTVTGGGFLVSETSSCCSCCVKAWSSR
jgi:hypothetical protein